jgi:glycosyltransferase involved in cell wall biosynthesis
MNLIHLTASTMFGGPERQMLGLARALRPEDRTLFLSFAEGGNSEPFLAAARRDGFEAEALKNDTPRLNAAVNEVIDRVERFGADVLLCHGYKADLLGRLAARRCAVPVVAVSRGWTGESLKVRLYEAVDRLHLRWMDRVVCVSEAQADKVRRAGVPAERVRVILNAVDPRRFHPKNEASRDRLLRLFLRRPAFVVGAAGRLSPEKGFEVLIAAAQRVAQWRDSAGFVIFGEGPCRAQLERQIREAGLTDSVVLAGFRADLDAFLPALDLLALSSFTEGMPNVVLEAFAAGVPVAATAVGGVPEVVEPGRNGFLAPAGDADALADRILDALSNPVRLSTMGDHGRRRIGADFGFAAQARRYKELIAELNLVRTAVPSATMTDESPDLIAAGLTCRP